LFCPLSLLIVFATCFQPEKRGSNYSKNEVIALRINVMAMGDYSPEKAVSRGFSYQPLIDPKTSDYGTEEVRISVSDVSTTWLTTSGRVFGTHQGCTRVGRP
jgi:hypothetical protein